MSSTSLWLRPRSFLGLLSVYMWSCVSSGDVQEIDKKWSHIHCGLSHAHFWVKLAYIWAYLGNLVGNVCESKWELIRQLMQAQPTWHKPPERKWTADETSKWCKMNGIHSKWKQLGNQPNWNRTQLGRKRSKINKATSTSSCVYIRMHHVCMCTRWFTS